MTVRLLEDLSPLERLSLIDMSYSRMDTYDMCAAKFFYSYILKEERVFGAPAALGSMVHSVLENVDWKEPLNVLDMHRDLESQRDFHDPERQISDDLIDVGYNVLSEFADRHEGDLVDNLGVEVPFAIVVGSALVSGYIDRVDRTPAGIHIIDYKTGKYEVAAKNIAQNLQVGIYALAMSKHYPDTTIKAELYYLRSGRRKSHTFTPEELTQVEQQLIDKVNSIIGDRSFHYTENTRVCSFCDFRKNGSCPVGIRRYGGTD